MPNLTLNSLDDPRLDPYRDLPRANLTALSRRFVVEGHWLVERLARSDYQIESIVAASGQLDRLPANLPESIPIFVLPPADIEKLIGFNFHRGVLACGFRKPFAAFRDLVPHQGRVTAVACLDIHDPTNLGGILRNCAAFGVDAVLLNKRCADPFSRRVLRVSMGTAFQLSIAMFDDDELDHLRGELHCEVVGTVLSDEAERLESAERPERMLLLFGNEGHGLSPETVSKCDRLLTLPMDRGTDSLNAAAASAVFLYQLTRIATTRRSDRAGF